jgi:hypothetical protein
MNMVEFGTSYPAHVVPACTVQGRSCLLIYPRWDRRVVVVAFVVGYQVEKPACDGLEMNRLQMQCTYDIGRKIHGSW